jgi:hypothetical protein
MKINCFKKVSLFISGFILCFLFIVPLSGAEQSNNELTKQGFSVEGLNALKGSLQEKGAAPVVQTDAVARQKASSFDVKIPLNERFNAIFSLGKPYISDLASRDIGKNYNAVIGFQIVLQ